MERIKLESAVKDDEIMDLKYKLDQLNKVAPRAGLIKQSEDLMSKNRSLQKRNTNLRVENENLKSTNTKLLAISKRFGTMEQQDSSIKTIDEILGGMLEAAAEQYEHFKSKDFDEVEIYNFISIVFMGLSGGMRFQVIKRFLKFSTPGVRRNVLSSLTKIVDDDKVSQEYGSSNCYG